MRRAPYAIDDSAHSENADIWFAMPPGFVCLPLDELTTSWCTPVQEPSGLAVFGPVPRLARLLLEAGTVHCSLGLHADDVGDGGTLLSLFTLAWRATGWAPRSVLAARAAAGAEWAEHIEALELPCGPAALVQTRLSAPSELGLTAPCELLQSTVYVPCPDGERIAILSLATTAVEQAGHYRALLTDIAGTVSFENPLTDAFTDVPDKD
ncbi:hypothetical protein ACFWIJ_19875 [Streptomyces sp. NPDC127079]|uniref:hypothetical protein n=1 Tax=Streptomyces sp. NPDC127079 TaxID=3347132 RepID=UPI003653EC70